MFEALFIIIDNWLYDFEMIWYKKPIWKKILMFPLILLMGRPDNINNNLR